LSLEKASFAGSVIAFDLAPASGGGKGTGNVCLGAIRSLGRTGYFAYFKESRKQFQSDRVKVSIIIPAYNAAATLSRTLDSISVQTFGNWEGIVVNDGSTDSTAEIAAAFAARESRIRVINRPNGGESAARNTGVAEATGDWLLFLDADDWVAPECLERLTAALQSDASLDAVHCGWVRVAADGTEVSESFRAPDGDLFPTLARRAAFPVHACMVRRALVEEAGRFDTTLRKSPDWDLWQRIARAGAKFGSIPQVLAFYRMTPGSASLEPAEMLRDGLTVLRRGRGADPRVPNPRPEYAGGITDAALRDQEYYLLCWCAGLLLGRGEDARPLLAMLAPFEATVDANAVAQCIFGAALLPACEPPSAWDRLLPRITKNVREFLEQLEKHTSTARLAEKAFAELRNLVVHSSALWRGWAEDAADEIASMRKTMELFTEGSKWLEADRDRWKQAFEAAQTKRDVVEAEWEESLESSKAALADASSRILDFERVVAEKHGALGLAETEISELERKLHLQDTELGAARRELEALHRTVEGQVLALDAAVKRISDLEHALRHDRATVADFQSTTGELEGRMEKYEAELASAHGQIAILERGLAEAEERARFYQQNAELLEELGKWQRSASERAVLIEELQQDPWMRLGLRLHATRRKQQVSPATLYKRSPAPAATSNGRSGDGQPPSSIWRVQISDDCEAHIVYPDEDHEMVQVDILKASGRARWKVQLNRTGLKAAAGMRHVVEFQARAKRPRQFGVGFAKDHEPWSSLGMYRDLLVGPEWQSYREEFVALEDDDRARIHFDLGGSAIGVDLTSVVFRELDVRAAYAAGRTNL
jgi:hypothetical protein